MKEDLLSCVFALSLLYAPTFIEFQKKNPSEYSNLGHWNPERIVIKNVHHWCRIIWYSKLFTISRLTWRDNRFCGESQVQCRKAGMSEEGQPCKVCHGVALLLTMLSVSSPCTHVSCINAHLTTETSQSTFSTYCLSPALNLRRCRR